MFMRSVLNENKTVDGSTSGNGSFTTARVTQ